jgi:hypothetical protein
MFDEKTVTKITWAVVIVSVIAIIGLGVFAATGLNYTIF